METKKCPICGETTSSYMGNYRKDGLCKKHALEFKNGKIIQCEKCNQWHNKEEDCKCKHNSCNTKCIVCGNTTEFEGYDNLFCKQCYTTRVSKIRNSFDHNKSKKQIQDNYMEIKHSITSYNDKENFIDGLCFMTALAKELSYIHNDNFLSSRVNKDIRTAINEFAQKQIEKPKDTKTSFNDKDFREKWPRECDDGHYVRSLSEKAIDDWLYNHNYLHAYEKSVYMETEPEAVVLSDFYIPEADLYLEFWGIEDNEQYEKRKEQKIKLYDDNQYKREDLYEKDVKRLNDIMPRILGKYIKDKKKK